jgi:plastocyanin
MPYVAVNPERYVGRSVGNGQCVAFARAAASIGHTSTWTRGDPVRGAKLAVGTAIATFDQDGRYSNDTHGKSHAAIYLGQDATGIQVLDQWMVSKTGLKGAVVKVPRPVSQRTIHFKPSEKPVNCGDNYYVIE